MSELERFEAWVDSFAAIADAALVLGVVENYIHKITSGERPITDSLRWRWNLQGGRPDKITSKAIVESDLA